MMTDQISSKERDSRSRSKERDSRSRSKERDSRSRSKERDSRSRSKERDSRSRSKERDSRSRSKERDSRSRSKERDSRSRSKKRDSRSRSKKRDSRSRSKKRDSRSRSKKRDSRSRSKKSGSRSLSKKSGSRSRSKKSGSRSRSKKSGSRSRSKKRDSRSRSKKSGSRSRSKKRDSRSRSKKRDSRSRSRKRDSRSRSKAKDFRSSTPERYEGSMASSRGKSSSPLTWSSPPLYQERINNRNASPGLARYDDTNSASNGSVQARSGANEEYLHDEVVFRRVVVQGLASTKAAVLKWGKRFPDMAPPDHELEELKKILPASTSTALEELNGSIDLDKPLYEKLVLYLSLGGGEDIGSTTRTAFRKIVTDEVQQLFSWEGLKKKKRFDKFKAIIRAINESVRRHFPNASDATIKSFITVDLRNAKQRWETKQRREKLEEVSEDSDNEEQ